MKLSFAAKAVLLLVASSGPTPRPLVAPWGAVAEAAAAGGPGEVAKRPEAKEKLRGGSPPRALKESAAAAALAPGHLQLLPQRNEPGLAAGGDPEGGSESAPSGADGGRDLQDEISLPPIADYLIYDECASLTSGSYGTIVPGMITNKSRTYAQATLDQLNAMTTADFKKYKAIVFADPGVICNNEIYLEGALNSSSAWSRAVQGNIVLMGTGEVWHAANYGQGPPLISSALDFVVSDPNKTGLYLSLSWFHWKEPSPKHVPVLDPFGYFEVLGFVAPCNDGHIVAPSHPLATSLRDEDISDWTPWCSAYEVFTSYPSSFQPVAIVRGFGNTSFADGSVGTPFILARGALQNSTQAPSRPPTTKSPAKNPTKKPSNAPSYAPTSLTGPPPVADYLIYDECASLTSGSYGTIVPGMITNKSRTYATATLDQLNAMTTADFKKYKAIIFADPGVVCNGEIYLEGALNSSSTWSQAVEGNIVLMGTYEVWAAYHYGQGTALISAALDYVVGEPDKTGLYLSLSWYYWSPNSAQVPVLAPFGNFKAELGISYARIVAPSHPLVANLTDEDISGFMWEVFTAYPSSFEPVAIALDVGNTAFADGSVGTPFILARGALQNSTQAPSRPPTTKSPAKNPTKAPTKTPTKAPTKTPTKAPTKKPTKSPTKNPTKAPTKNPTKSPTKNPTKPPTKKPTKTPTKNPTKAPTKSPTKKPTKAPTKNPTKVPATNATKAPTKGPTKSPTQAPTAPPNEPRLVCTKLNRKCARPSECCAPANKACDGAPGKPRTCKVCLAAGRACARTAQCCAAGSKVCDGPAGNKTCKACLKKNSRCARPSQCCRGFSCKGGKCLP